MHHNDCRPGGTLRCNERQPASRLQASRARGLAFSHVLMERVSLESIFSFMQTQYLRTTSALAPSFLLSSMHWLIHFTSSASIF